MVMLMLVDGVIIVGFLDSFLISRSRVLRLYGSFFVVRYITLRVS